MSVTINLRNFYTEYLTDLVIERGTELKDIKQQAMKYVANQDDSTENKWLVSAMMKDYDVLRQVVNEHYMLNGCRCMIGRMYVTGKRGEQK